MSSAYAQQYKILSPTQISGCVLWMDGQDTNNMNLTDTTINWIRDKSANGYFISSMSGNQKPKVTTSFNTNYTAIAALNEGTGNKIIGTPRTIAATSVQGATGLSFFLVAQFITGYGLVQFEQTGTGGTRIIDIETNGNNARIDYNNISLLPSDALNTPFLGSVVYNSNAQNIAWFYNGNASSNATQTSATLSYSSGYGFFGQNSGTSGNYPTFGYIGEYVGYNAALTATQRQQVEGYLAWKWGLQNKLPSSHPYYATNAALFGFSNIPPVLYPNYQTKKNIFSPTQISGCSLWYDAADTSKLIQAGSSVTKWTSKGTNAIQITNAANYPTYVSNAYNQLGTIRFDFATNQSLSNGSVANSVVQTNTNHTIFLVHNPNTNNSTPFGFLDSTGTGTKRLSVVTPETSNIAYDIGGRLTYSYASQATYLNGNLRLETLYVSGGNRYYRRDGSQLATNGTISSSFDATQILYIGGAEPSYPNYRYGGDYCEIVWFNTDLTTTQIQQMEGYLAWKWGIVSYLPSSHPYKNTPLYTLAPIPTQAIPLFAQQNTSYLIDSPLYYSFGIPVNGFTASIPITTAGNASITSGYIQLTPNLTSQTGSAYYQTRVKVSKFSTQFNLRFDSTGADGACFVIQNSSSNALGVTGGGLGYSNVGNSIAIRFDTWNGSGGQFSTDILSGGSVTPDQGASGVLNTNLGLTAGTTWNFLVKASYDGTTFSYTIQNFSNANQSFTSNRAIDIPTTIGSSSAWIGFSSATGGSTEACYLLSWNWSNAK